MDKLPRDADADLPAEIVATFAVLIHAWQANDFSRAATAKADLERLGVKVAIPARRKRKAAALAS